MRCEYCPLSSADDVCPEAEGKYGIEFKDGGLGCKHPRSWVNKRDAEYSAYLGDMGLDMGISMRFTETELEKVIDICKHMVGLDHKRPYHRYGKAFYKPYRNYFAAMKFGNRLLDKLPEFVIKRTDVNPLIWYELTDEGLGWLGRQLKIVIRSDDK